MQQTKIGVLTSGGDCPGLNAVIRGVCRAAYKLKWEVLGFKDGFEGLLPPGDYVLLDRPRTSGIMHLGGTILGTTNRGHFVAKVAAGERAMIPKKVVEDAKTTFDKLGLSALIAIGGDGSLSTALQLHEEGIPIIGVPKTIDNDLEATAMTFGFDSAVACVADALDRLHTTATSHKRVMVLEVMGRHAGWIALYGGFAGGADVILIPEIPFDYDKVAEEVMRRDKVGAKSTMIVVAEGASPRAGKQHRHATASGEHRLGGIAEIVGSEIAERTGKEVRTCVLGHLQRGGAPTALDRILGTRFGIKAVQLITEKKFGTMVSYQNYLTLDVPISHAVNRLRRVDPEGQMVETARAAEIFLRHLMAPTEALRAAVRDVADFPRPGVLFKDITPILGDGTLLRVAIDCLVADCLDQDIRKIVGIDARGFLFGATVADRLGIGFVPIRKRGKLPWKTESLAYKLEYGEAEMEVHVDAFEPGERVSLIDDLLATGGTAAAASKLIAKAGGNVVQAQFLIELGFLAGRAAIAPVPAKSIILY